MKKVEKIDFLLNNHLREWIDTRRQVEDELSQKQPMICVCGRLATGLHESSCTRFQGKVTSETIKRLSGLIEG